MASEEDSRRSRRDALLAMHAQAGGAPRQEMRPPEIQPTRDLSQIRPVVQQSVSEQERNARQVFSVAMGSFIAAKPEIEGQMRRADSQLLRFFQATEA